MTRTTFIALLLASAVLASERAAAQTAPPTKNLFVDVNVGVQPGSQIFTMQSTPLVYEETAIITARQGVNGSGVLDVTAGYRVWGDVSVALGLSTTFTNQGDASVVGGIPHPVFYDRRVETTVEVSDLAHQERSAHLSIMWTSPMTDKIDASVAAGPSFIKVFQDLASRVTVTPGTLNFVPIGEGATGTTFGFHIGGDVTYLLTPRLGAGLMVRYVAADVDIGPVVDLKAGGLQYAIGLRLRF
jgi:hypothetical protein